MLARTLSDLRLSVRSLVRRPGFTVGVVLVLSLGIGASAAMLTVVRHVLLDPLPFSEPERLVWGWGTASAVDRASVSPPDYLDYRDQSGSFAELAAMTSFVARFTLSGEGPPERVAGAFVSANFLAALGLAPALGRSFRVEEARDGATPVTMISHGLWQRRFGADPAILGRTVRVDGQSREIVGVLPAGLDFPAEAEIWQPIPFDGPETTVRRFHFLRVIGRLAPGVDLGQAQAEVHAIAARLEAAYPDSNSGWTMTLEPLRERLVGSARLPLTILLGAVGLVLAIVCANVAMLMLVRAFGRRGELAIRRALGASRRQLVAGLLTESLLLGLAGGVVGLAGAFGALRLAARWVPDALPRLGQIQPGVDVIAAALAVTVVSVLLFGLVPAWRASRRELSGDAASAMRGIASRSVTGGRGRGTLVVVQVALSMVLLVGALLLLRSYSALQAVDPGFDPAGRVVAEVPLPRYGFDDPVQRVALFSRLVDRVAALPGVESAAAIDVLPWVGSPSDTRVWREDRPESGEGADAVRFPQVRKATPGYFAALDIPLLRGRAFRATDGLDAPPVVVINETAAGQLFEHGEEPVGRRVVLDLGDPWTAEVVGVVGDTRIYGPDQPAPPAVYMSQWQRPGGVMRLVMVPAAGEMQVAALAPALRALLTELDPELPLAGLERYEDLIAATFAATRLRTGLLTAFAVTALVLAALGLYSLLSFLVGQRTRELGVRMALGAQRRDVLGLVLGRGLALAGVGLAAGLLVALGLGRLLRGLLFGVGVADPVTLVVGPAVLAAAALLASLLPARRATRVEPATVLRQE